MSRVLGSWLPVMAICAFLLTDFVFYASKDFVSLRVSSAAADFYFPSRVASFALRSLFPLLTNMFDVPVIGSGLISGMEVIYSSSLFGTLNFNDVFLSFLLCVNTSVPKCYSHRCWFDLFFLAR